MPTGGPRSIDQTSAECKSQEAHLKEWFQAGVAAARAGRLQQAQDHLRRVTAHDPQNEEAWLWLAGVADDPQETLVCLAQALTINPRNKHAKAAIRWARAKLVEEGRALSVYSTDGVASPMMATTPSPAVTGQAAPPSKKISGIFHILWVWVVSPIVLGVFKGDGQYDWAPTHDKRKITRVSFRWAMGLLIATLLLGWMSLTLFTTVGAEARRMVSAAPTLTVKPMATPLPTATPTRRELITALRSELDRAWQAEDWQRALRVLEQIQVMAPGHKGLQQELFTAYLLRGLELVEANQLEEAIVHFERALAIRPDDPTTQSQWQAATGYLTGMKSYRQADWGRAVEELTAVYNMNPDYKEVSAWLYSAHLNRGLAMQGQGQLKAAQGEYQRALEVKSDGEDARIKLDEVTSLLAPPSPTPQPIPNATVAPIKRIEVDISEQHFYAYEGDILVHSFVCSTGESGRDTAPGSYQVLDKIPMAYASTWNLKMPYWLGIYWAGTLENGIHALPLLPSGQKLWDGYLGQRVSYGCIILSTEDAETIYNWAEIGTLVIIRR